MAERIRRSGDHLVLTLHPAEIEVLRDLGRQLETLFADEGGGGSGEPGESGEAPARGQDPVRDRLFPRAYLDPTADAEEADWQAAVHGDLVRQKSEAVEALVASLDASAPTAGGNRPVEVPLDPEAAERWANALNDVRLALGVVLEVGDDEIDVAPGDPRAPGFELYGWLTWLQGSLIEELLGGADEIWRAARDYG